MIPIRNGFRAPRVPGARRERETTGTGANGGEAVPQGMPSGAGHGANGFRKL